MKTILIFTAVLILAAQFANAQVTENWVAKYNGPANGSDFGKSIVTDGSGNTYVTGVADSLGTSAMVTAKYNSLGVLQWSVRYFGTGGDAGGEMVVLDDTGNVYVTGFTTDAGTGNDFVTIKYNSSGVQQWLATYNGPLSDNESPTALALDASGNVYVTGTGPTAVISGYDFITVKYSPSGSQAWARHYNLVRSSPFGGSEQATCIGTDAGGNVYVAGHSIAAQDTDKVVVIAYTSSGDTLFKASYAGIGSGGRYINSIAVSSSGNIYLCGYDYSGPSAGVNYITMKYSGGALSWIKTYSGTSGGGYDEATKVVLDASENVYVTGYTSEISSTNDFTTIKYNSSGDSIWVRKYNNTANGDDRAQDMQIDASGNTYITGWSRDTGSRYDYLTLKYNSSGTKLWDIRYNASHAVIDTKPYAVSLDNAGNVYVTGFSNGSTGNEDITTIKYSETPTGITGIGNTAPESFSLSQNYPNPFNPSTTINYELKITNYVKLNVYDATGKLVSALINNVQHAGKHAVTFDGGYLSSGVYFYKLETEGFTDTKRMLLLK